MCFHSRPGNSSALRPALVCTAPGPALGSPPRRQALAPAALLPQLRAFFVASLGVIRTQLLLRFQPHCPAQPWGPTPCGPPPHESNHPMSAKGAATPPRPPPEVTALVVDAPRPFRLRAPPRPLPSAFPAPPPPLSRPFYVSLSPSPCPPSLLPLASSFAPEQRTCPGPAPLPPPLPFPPPRPEGSGLRRGSLAAASPPPPRPRQDGHRRGR